MPEYKLSTVEFALNRDNKKQLNYYKFSFSMSIPKFPSDPEGWRKFREFMTGWFLLLRNIK